MAHNIYGQCEYMTRVPTRRQLEQWHECRGVHTESEQCAYQYQYEHWVPRRQELDSSAASLEEVAAKMAVDYGRNQRAFRDLPFALSWPMSFIRLRPNRRVGGEYPPFGGLSLLAYSTRYICG